MQGWKRLRLSLISGSQKICWAWNQAHRNFKSKKYFLWIILYWKTCWKCDFWASRWTEISKFSGPPPLEPVGWLTAPPKRPSWFLPRFAWSITASLRSYRTLHLIKNHFRQSSVFIPERDNKFFKLCLFSFRSLSSSTPSEQSDSEDDYCESPSKFIYDKLLTYLRPF